MNVRGLTATKGTATGPDIGKCRKLNNNRLGKKRK
jgi:hypothetical protein